MREIDSPAVERPLRADAQRNRDAIVQAARLLFEAEGVYAPLDGIAARAGVGNATLYRNFPTREDLLAAVMAEDLAAAVAHADTLASDHAPGDALAKWLSWLSWRLRIWHDLPQCIAAAQSAGDTSMNPAVAALMQATASLLSRAQDGGFAIVDLAPGELFELVTALSWATDRYGDDAAAAERRVTIATAGLFVHGSS